MVNPCTIGAVVLTSIKRGSALRTAPAKKIAILITMLLTGCVTPQAYMQQSTATSSMQSPSTNNSLNSGGRAELVAPSTNSPATVIPSNHNDIAATTAWESQPLLKTIPLAVESTRTLIPLTITPDVQFLVGSLVPRDVKATDVGSLVIVDIATQKVTMIHQLSSPLTQVIGADADDSWIVWSEATQQASFHDWVLYSYYRPTGEVKQIAAAITDQSGIPVASPFVLPRIDHGIVTWAQGTSNVEETPFPAVYIADLTTGMIRAVSQNGFTPTISWPYVAWVEPQEQESTNMPGARKGLITLMNVLTNQTKQLQHVDTPLYFDLYKETIVWIPAKGDAVMMTDTAESHQQVLARVSTQDDTFQFPMLNERVVAWVSYTHAQVWDRVQKRVITLESEQGQIPEIVNGHALLWVSPGSRSVEERKADKQAGRRSNKGILQILDTSKLP